jgi:soluble lytic murein transglycosylase
LVVTGLVAAGLQAATVAPSDAASAKTKSDAAKSKATASSTKAATKSKSSSRAKKAETPKKNAKKETKGRKETKKEKKATKAPSTAKAAVPNPVPRPKTPSPVAPSLALAAAIPAADIAAAKQAIEHARAGRPSQATDIQQNIRNPIARKTVEWAILRSDNNRASSSRYISFITSNPNWPSIGLMRRRAESMMWSEQPTPGAVRAYFAKRPPLSSKGHLTYARALLAQGDRAGAQAQLRDVWRHDSFGGDLEAKAIETFGGLITADDHKARMDMRLYAEDIDGALRSAKRAGGHAQAIAKARIAVIKKAGNAKAALDAVPSEARRDVGYIFSLAQWLRRADRPAEAGNLILSMPRNGSQTIDTDQWWIERRLAARNMLDLGDASKAYRIARDAVVPKRENYRAEHQFTAGWIALRFLNDPATALTHFTRVADEDSHVITRARAHYWQGRAYEALGRNSEARNQYQLAARYPTTYYGQIAGGRLGLRNITLRSPPSGPSSSSEIVRAMELLYAVGQRDMVAGAAADLGDRSNDAAALAAIGEAAGRNGDARAMLLLGKAALGRGLPLETYAFPTIGMPNYTAIGPAVEKPLVYAIARQESTFNQKTISSARAMGLMQVTPAAGRYVSKKFNVKFNEKKLLSDPVYNVQLGAAELGDLLSDFRGSYILAFVGYNAGRGRIRDWVARFGDPRDPKVDPIDWVERIPFSETRNYVQRVMENMQVYRIRFGGGDKLMIEADLRRGTSAN